MCTTLISQDDANKVTTNCRWDNFQPRSGVQAPRDMTFGNGFLNSSGQTTIMVLASISDLLVQARGPSVSDQLVGLQRSRWCRNNSRGPIPISAYILSVARSVQLRSRVWSHFVPLESRRTSFKDDYCSQGGRLLDFPEPRRNVFPGERIMSSSKHVLL